MEPSTTSTRPTASEPAASSLPILEVASKQRFDVAIHDNGKIVLAGETSAGSDYDFAVAQYHGGTMQTTAENTDLVFSQANGNEIRFDDVDAGTEEVRVNIFAENGTVHLSTLEGITITYGADESDEMWITCTIDDINLALDGMTFTPTPDHTGWASVVVTINDQAHTGSGDPTGEGLAGKVDIAVGVDPVTLSLNQAPVNTVPVVGRTYGNPITTDEDTATDPITGLSVSDDDATDNVDSILVRLVAYNGTISLSQTTGLTLIDPGSDGYDETSMRIWGTENAINAALAGMTFTPNENFTGMTYLTIGTLDMGTRNVGDGMDGTSDFPGIGVDGDPLFIYVIPENDPPEASLEGSTTLDYTEDTGPVVICDDISVTDVDDTHMESARVQITGNYHSTEDVLDLDSGFSLPTGITSVVWNPGNGTLEITGTATLAEYESILENVTYTNDTADYTDTRTITWIVNDGQYDSLGQESIINVTAVKRLTADRTRRVRDR